MIECPLYKKLYVRLRTYVRMCSTDKGSSGASIWKKCLSNNIEFFTWNRTQAQVGRPDVRAAHSTTEDTLQLPWERLSSGWNNKEGRNTEPEFSVYPGLDLFSFTGRLALQA